MSNDYQTELYNIDLDNYSGWLSDWNAEHGGVVGGNDLLDSTQRFGKWMVWRCVNGTVNYGNLQSRKRDHVGLSCALCPYDSSANDIRVINMLGSIPTQVDHGMYYMKVTQRGSVWGFECTYSGCPYLIENGHPYFYV
jgi:hypothetical protein